MVRSDGFLLVSDTAILRTLYFLKDHGVDPQQILRIPWLLLQSTDSLEQKFQKLLEQYLFLTLSDGLGFSRFSHQQIVKYQKYFAKEAGQFPDYQNRIYYIAGRMEMPVALVTEKIVQPKQMLRMDINRIDYIINIFQKHGVHMRDVVADLWVFCHNVQLTESRLQQAVQAGCVHPKPWICHSSPHVFERYLGRLQSKTLVLGEDGALETYLSDRLDCPLYEVNANFRRNPGLKSVHVSRIKSKLDLLFAEGFTPEDIRRDLTPTRCPPPHLCLPPGDRSAATPVIACQDITTRAARVLRSQSKPAAPPGTDPARCGIPEGSRRTGRRV
ncbi:Transcription termination factor, mitochondrial [Chionoecetes opilio]|uniref:Transcription termination factor, mitochondrial n=1 Tax=Chionoecetes opilio TaxID=41210 RepID=A0A8J4XP42_CHIOP|nr:Transcription termination factor, mitochondrial [Chionoecetes opilio]